MRRLVKMPGRVLVFGIIAASDVTARFAKAQMHPAVARFQTFFAAVRRSRRRRFYFPNVWTRLLHFVSLYINENQLLIIIFIERISTYNFEPYILNQPDATIL
jgi:hypothetical protein